MEIGLSEPKRNNNTDDGIIIKADNFEYDKSLNILNANGKVKVNDKVNNY